MADNEIRKAFDILEKIEFFGGQRAGRELWFNKPIDIQNKDLGKFLRDIDFLKAFINCQQAEIERLNSLVDDHFWDFCSIAGCEGASNDCWKTCPDSRYNKIKNEAIREFAEKLKELYTDDSITDDYHCAVGVIKQNIDDIVKEMVGDTE